MMFIGFVLIAVGILALLIKLGLLPGSLWDYVWPVVLIALGLSFIWGQRRMRVWSRRWWQPPDDVKK